MSVQPYQRNIVQRVCGIPMTKAPSQRDCWQYKQGQVIVDLDKIPELNDFGGAINIDDHHLPVPILIIKDGQGDYHAYCNKCGHGGRRLDPVLGRDKLQCCSWGQSSYDLDGKVLSGPATHSPKVYPVRQEGHQLIIEFDQVHYNVTEA